MIAAGALDADAQLVAFAKELAAEIPARGRLCLEDFTRLVRATPTSDPDRVDATGTPLMHHLLRRNMNELAYRALTLLLETGTRLQEIRQMSQVTRTHLTPGL